MPYQAALPNSRRPAMCIGPQQRSAAPSHASAKGARLSSDSSEPYSTDWRSSPAQAKLRDLVRICAFPEVTPRDWVVLSSGFSAIAQADVTRHAKEIPIVRRIGIASHPLLSIPSPRAIELAVHAKNADGLGNADR